MFYQQVQRIDGSYGCKSALWNKNSVFFTMDLGQFLLYCYNHIQRKNYMRKIIQKGVSLHEESTRDKIIGRIDNQNGISSLAVIDLQQSLNGSHQRIRFNVDKKFYTSTFIVQEQESNYIHNDSLIRQNFKRKMNQYNNIKATIFKPKPLLHYCQVCKETYQDYEKHIIHPIHKKNIFDSTAESYINDLCFQLKNGKRGFQDVEKDAQSQSINPRKRFKKEDSINGLIASSNIIQSNIF